MQHPQRFLAIALLLGGLTACAATGPSESNSSPDTTQTVKTPPTSILGNAPFTVNEQGGGLTMEQIMSDPDWIGQLPQNPYWGDGSGSVLFERKRSGQELRDLWKKPLNQSGNGAPVALNELHSQSYKDRVLNAQATKAAWTYAGNIFVKDLATGEVQQLTRDQNAPGNLLFLHDNRLSYQMGNGFYVIDLSSGLSELLVHWKFAKKPEAVSAPKDYLAEQQLELIDVMQQNRLQRQARFEQQQQEKQLNGTQTPDPIYFKEGHVTVEASLSPNGRWVIVSERKDRPTRSEGDIMPNYISEDGRIKSDKVRKRVHDAKPQGETLWLLDVQRGSKSKLAYLSLSGHNEDVLADVKRENAAARGEDYQSNRLPREIRLMVDWYWRQSAIQWHNNGQQVAVMLEAWDNKDRWIATVDLDKALLVEQHRLHDDAWINYKFNSFGWLNQSESLYYLSEQSGFSHLYVKPIDGKARALTQGRFEVDNLTLSRTDQHLYFKANQKHPGIYEIYRVNLASGAIEPLTDLNGMTDYRLSPDESKLLLTHSKLTQPPELYIKSLDSQLPAERITHTISEQFSAIKWQAPDIVPVESSHVTDPVYSRVYQPTANPGDVPRRAVIFSHGAGYLQNSHLGWSGYFREFMFHNLLVQHGYVVMDMDYRASAGYGRDWRTAIYRHMGKAEVEDLADGVDWLVKNANVDRERVGTYGGSYGGFMTFMALFTQPDLFQAGAALRPVTDWAHYNHPYTANILNTPDVDPIAYERSSPIYFAEGLKKHLLINAPMVDSNVFFVDVVRLVQRLIELEKENFETAIYPVESHGFKQPSSWLDEYRRIFKLFEQNL